MSKELMLRAANEIKTLRRVNEVLSAKVEMIDLFACVLHTRPAEHTQGMGVDVAWELEKAAEKMDLPNAG